MNQDSVRKEWNEGAESFSSFVQEGKDFYREELNNPATFRLIGDVKRKKVLDLACGEGYNTRILARKGAVVIGVDFSEKLIEIAREKEREERLGIICYASDAATMGMLSSNDFDLVTCFMALQDIEHCEKAISEVARVLRDDGRFIFSIPHPCFCDHIVKNGENITRWEREDKSLVIKQYFDVGKYEVRWDMPRIPKPFATTAFHRTLSDYFCLLHRNGFLVSRLVEPRPDPETVKKHPHPFSKHLKIPQSIVIEAVKSTMSPSQ